ncbi:MAG: flagellar biosynthetic protein FliQ [Pirellulaceae bacterium]|nr:flagellar biosynthetic protein FliQ [Planctomycetales bacterium]
MDMATVSVISRDILYTAILLSAPTVLTSLLVGVMISILQTVTSIQEQTLSLAPRMMAASLVLIITLPWSLKVLAAFTERMITMAAGAGP